MGKKIENPFNKFNWACQQFYNLKGLIASIIILFLVIQVIALLFLQFDDLDKSIFSFLSTAQFYISVFFGGVLLLVILWFIKRSVPKVKKEKIGILFAPSHPDEISGELHDLSIRLRKELESKDFAKIISIKTLPPNIEVGGHDRNMKILNRANAAILICGNFENFTLDGKSITGFTSFSITTKSLPVAPKNTAGLLTDAIAGRQFGWTSENTIHKNVVVDNLSEIARYIVALSLLVERKFYNAKVILAPLFMEVKRKFKGKRIPIEFRRFIGTIQTAYIGSMVREVSGQYTKELLNEKLFSLDESIIRKWEAELNQALAIDSKNWDALAMMSIIKFLLDDLYGALESIRKARSYSSPKHHVLCDISEAFLLCFEGSYRNSKMIYKRIINRTPPPNLEMMNNVLSFLAQAIPVFTNKPQLSFSYALLNDEFGDKAIALKEYEKFIIEAEDINELSKWKREAKLRALRIKKLMDNNTFTK